LNEFLKTALANLQCEFVAERNMVNPKEITWFQYDILAILREERSCLPAYLGQRLGVTRVKLSKGLKGLKDKGYIVQQKGEDDGREMITRLTTKGIQLLNKIDTAHDDLKDTVEQVLSSEEQLIYTELSVKITQALKERRLSNEK
jgi:MarR family transcriptional repressor of emrRAB